MATDKSTGFKALLEELDLMTKSNAPGAADTNADDKKIAAAAADVDGDADADKEAAAAAAAASADADKDGKPMAKALKIVDASGEEHEVVDATDLLKALNGRLDTTESTTLKAFDQVIGLVRTQAETIKSQGDMIKSLTSRVESFANEGKGRKAVVIVNEPAKEAKKEPEGITQSEFMVKALAAQNLGRISGSDVARCESYFNRNLQPPAEIVEKVLGQ